MTGEIQFHPERMYDVIASSFFQKKSCRLPGIGMLELVTMPAEFDYATQQIKSPRQKILFSSSLSSDNIFNEFSAISQLMKEGLDNDETVEVTGLGSFQKDSGIIQFTPQELPEDFFQPVAAERVIQKDSRHAILVGDKETTNVLMNEYYTEETEEVKDRWWIWAIVLGAVALAVIAYYFSQKGFSDLSNTSPF